MLLQLDTFGKPGDRAAVGPRDRLRQLQHRVDAAATCCASSFDRKRPPDGVNRRKGGRQYVNSRFGFGGTDGREHYLGETYSGEWADASTFELVAIDTAISRPRGGHHRRPLVVGAAQRRRHRVRRVAEARRSRGSFGRDGPPVLVAFEAADPMQTRPGPSPYDTLTRASTARPTSASRRFGRCARVPYNENVIGRFFTFSSALGGDARGTWVDASTFTPRPRRQPRGRPHPEDESRRHREPRRQ